MTCDEYGALLEKLLEGTASPAEEALLRQHEASCPDCAQQRAAIDRLPEQLASLAQDMPPMPADFHQGWMKCVEDNMMQENHQPKKHASRTAWQRVLSIAAAAAFVVGGTLLTRDSLFPGKNAVAPLSSTAQTETEYDTAEGSDSAIGYRSRAAEANNAPITMMSTSGADTMAADNNAAVADKKIIRTVSLSLATLHFDDSVARLKTLCEQNGGWIESISENASTAGNKRSASMTLRIPADQLDAFLQDAGGADRVLRRNESAQDVTADYQDTQARLNTQKALMERLQGMIASADNLTDLLALESQIADTQYTLDMLQSSLNATDRQVNYASVDVSLKEDTAAEQAQAAELTLGDRIVGGLRTGWDTLIGFLGDAAVFLVAVLPFLAVVAVVGIVVRIVYRRKHSK